MKKDFFRQGLMGRSQRSLFYVCRLYGSWEQVPDAEGHEADHRDEEGEVFHPLHR